MIWSIVTRPRSLAVLSLPTFLPQTGAVPPTHPCCAAHFNPLFQNVHLLLLSNSLHRHVKCHSLPTTPSRWSLIQPYSPPRSSPPTFTSSIQRPAPHPLQTPASRLCYPLLQRLFVVAAVECAFHRCEDCWPWWLDLAAAMINATTRQEASTSTGLAKIYLLTQLKYAAIKINLSLWKPQISVIKIFWSITTIFYLANTLIPFLSLLLLCLPLIIKTGLSATERKTKTSTLSLHFNVHGGFA